MPEFESLAELTKLEVSCVLLTEKLPVTVARLNQVYKQLVFKDIPFRQLGFDTLEEYVLSITDVVDLFATTDEQILCMYKPQEKTVHVREMVSKQVSRSRSKTMVFRTSEQDLESNSILSVYLVLFYNTIIDRF
jgi:hypothetical protein